MLHTDICATVVYFLDFNWKTKVSLVIIGDKSHAVLKHLLFWCLDLTLTEIFPEIGRCLVAIWILVVITHLEVEVRVMEHSGWFKLPWTYQHRHTDWSNHVFSEDNGCGHLCSLVKHWCYCKQKWVNRMKQCAELLSQTSENLDVRFKLSSWR